jgi:hypothetical protein
MNIEIINAESALFLVCWFRVQGVYLKKTIVFSTEIYYDGIRKLALIYVK